MNVNRVHTEKERTTQNALYQQLSILKRTIFHLPTLEKSGCVSPLYSMCLCRGSCWVGCDSHLGGGVLCGLLAIRVGSVRPFGCEMVTSGVMPNARPQSKRVDILVEYRLESRLKTRCLFQL